MTRYVESDCVGCPHGCVNCGRNRDYIEYECDICHETPTDDRFLENVDGKEMCSSCIEALLEEEDQIWVNQ